jgi:hypothetical protein
MKDKPMENEVDVDVDAVLALAALIRKVDGKHSLGAAALAEALLGHPDFLKVVAPLLLSERIEPLNPFYRQSRALQEAFYVLSDISDGEHETTDAATNLKWAEDRASEVLGLIISLTKHH